MNLTGINFLEMTIRNFLSVGNITQVIQLNQFGLTLIMGDNIDIGDTNGCGKTTILQAISYVLFNELITKIRLDNCINNLNNKNMLVTIKFMVNGKTYLIERGRKPNILKFFVDGQLNEAKGVNASTQDDIEKVLQISHLMFTHIVALNTYTDPFMKLKAGPQREVIEELLGITQLSQRAASLKELIDLTKDQLRDEEAKLKADGEANTRIEQAIIRAQAEAVAWQMSHDRQVSALLEKADAMSLVEIDAELAIFDQIDEWTLRKHEIDDLARFSRQEVNACVMEIGRLQKEIARYQDEAARVDNGEIARLEAQAKRYLAESQEDITVQLNRLASEAARRRTEAEANSALAGRLDSEIVTLREHIASPDAHTCTTCGQGLVGTDHLTAVLARLDEQLAELSRQSAKALAGVEVYQQQAEAIEREIEQTSEKHTLKKDEALVKAIALKDDIKVATAVLLQQKEIAARRVIELQEMVVAIGDRKAENSARLIEADTALVRIGAKPVSGYASREAVKEIKKAGDLLLNQIEVEMAKVNVHLSKIEGLVGTLVVLNYDFLNELTLRLKHEAFLYKLLTAKDSFIRKRIVDQNLMYLNNRLNFYLEKLRLPHEVRVIADLTVDISLLGRQLDFEQLSRGEQNRIILATFWSFRDVWQNLNCPINLFFIDEILDSGLSLIGTDCAVQILQDMSRDHGKNIFLISHKEHLRERIDNVLIARKEDQFTMFMVE